MRITLISSAMWLFVAGCVSNTPTAYFPPDIHQGWYAKHYRALREKPIWKEASHNAKTEIYRFLSLPTFENPILVRIDVSEDGTKVATFKKSTGKGGYEAGTLGVSKVTPVSEIDFAVFTNLLRDAKFWNLPNTMPVDPRKRGCDGSQEIIEVVKNGKYHVVDWWSPDSGPYFLTCVHLQRLGFPELLYPPLSFFYQQYDDYALRVDTKQLDQIKDWSIEKHFLDALGSPQVEEVNSNGKNVFYRLETNGCLAVRYDKNGVRLRTILWSEYLFNKRMDNQPSERTSQ